MLLAMREKGMEVPHTMAFAVNVFLKAAASQDEEC
jgi:hypothetical protein